MPTLRNKNKYSGQSLVEILVAVTVGVVIILGVITIIAPSLKISTDTLRGQIASALGKQLLDNVRVMAEGTWHSIDFLATSSANKYYLITSSSPFMATSGIESVAVATTTYTRYFYLNDFSRGGVVDPSTKVLTVVFSLQGGTNRTLQTYLTRSNDVIFDQTDWSGGGNQAGPITRNTTYNLFATSSGIDYATSTGSIVIQGF